MMIDSETTVMALSRNQRLLSVLSKLFQRCPRLSYRGGVSSPHHLLLLGSADLPDVIVSEQLPVRTEDILIWRMVRDRGPRVLILTSYISTGDEMRASLAGVARLVLIPEPRLADVVLDFARGNVAAGPVSAYPFMALAAEHPGLSSVDADFDFQDASRERRSMQAPARPSGPRCKMRLGLSLSNTGQIRQLTGQAASLPAVRAGQAVLTPGAVIRNETGRWP